MCVPWLLTCSPTCARVQSLHSQLPATAAGATHLRLTSLGGKETEVDFSGVSAWSDVSGSLYTLCFGSVWLQGSMFWVVPCRPQNLCLTPNSRPALQTHFFFLYVSKYVLIQTLKRSFFFLPSLLPFPFLNRKECLEGLLERRLLLQSVYESKCIKSLTLQVHFAYSAIFGILTKSLPHFKEKLFLVWKMYEISVVIPSFSIHY